MIFNPSADNTPTLFFPVSTKRPDPSWGPISRADCPLFGFIPSMFIGIHVGWEIDGKQYPAYQFYETSVPWNYTGGQPVGLTPIDKDWPFTT